MTQLKNEMKRIKSHLSVVFHNSDCVEIRNGVWNAESATFSDAEKEGKLWKIFHMLDGNHSVRDIVGSAGVSQDELEGLFRSLESQGLLENAGDHDPDFLYQDHFESQNIVVVGQGRIARILTEQLSGDASPLAAAMTEELRVSDLSTDYEPELYRLSDKYCSLRGAFFICVQDESDPVFFRKFSLLAKNMGISWLHGIADGPWLVVGPTFSSASGTPCFECLESRILLNIHQPEEYRQYKLACLENKIQRGSPFSSKSGVPQLAASLLRLEAEKLIRFGKNTTGNRLLLIHLPGMSFSYHELLRVSGCGGCDAFSQAAGGQLFYDYQSCCEEREMACVSG